MSKQSAEFFVGYRPRMPPATAAFLKRRVGVLLAVVPMIAVALTATQRPFSTGRFEFGTLTPFEGIVRLDPYPTLMLTRPDQYGDGDWRSTYYLVAPGKHGAGSLLADADGRRVRFMGTRIYQDNQTMIEVNPDSVESADVAEVESSATPLGSFTLRGEIVDSKCYLGVMKPGHLKPHRSCAIRCISGGIPPVLVVRDDQGTATYLVLVSAEGEPVNQAVLDRVAVPLEITGQVERRDGLLYLKAEPSTYRRL